MKELFLAGRLLLGGFLLYSGARHFTDVVAMTSYAARKGVPLPMVAVLAAGLLLIVAAVTLILGIAPRIGVAALVVFFVPVTLTMHAFWREEGLMRAMDLTNFTKNVALLGAALTMLGIPEPWAYSAAARARVQREAAAH